MVVLVAYNKNYGLIGKLNLMKECRRVAKKYSQFKIISFDTDSQTIDIIDSVLSTFFLYKLFLILIKKLNILIE